MVASCRLLLFGASVHVFWWLASGYVVLCVVAMTTPTAAWYVVLIGKPSIFLIFRPTPPDSTRFVSCTASTCEDSASPSNFFLIWGLIIGVVFARLSTIAVRITRAG